MERSTGTGADIFGDFEIGLGIEALDIYLTLGFGNWSFVVCPPPIVMKISGPGGNRTPVYRTCPPPLAANIFGPEGNRTPDLPRAKRTFCH